MAYRIGNVRMVNFGPFVESEVSLDYDGITVVEGQIEDVRGCDSNGAGKSFIFDAVSWCLYGRCIRPRYKGDAIIRLDVNEKPAKGGAEVHVEITGGSSPVQVIRYRKHSRWNNQLRLLVDGEDVSRGTDAQTELAIQTLLGVDFLTFCNSVAFGVREDIQSFFFATDTERKKILDTLLGLELYAVAEKGAKVRVRQMAEELNGVEQDIQTAETTLENHRETLESLASSSEIREKKNARKKATRKLKSLTEYREEARETHDELVDEQSDVEDSLTKERKKFGKLYDTYTTAKTELDRAYVEADTTSAFAVVKSSEYEAKIDGAKQQTGITCPTCEQEVSEEHTEAVCVELKAVLKGARKNQKVAEAELKKIQKKLDELEPPEAVDESELEEVTERLREAKSVSYKAKTDVDAQKRIVATLNDAVESTEEKRDHIQDKIDKQESILKHLQDSIGDQTQKLAQLEFWASAFGNNGLKSFLIEAEIPEINRHATQYAQKLLGRGAVVRLEATSTLKTGASREKLTVDGSIPNYTKSYAGASKGQKKRMDLSLLLAFRRVVASRAEKAIDQVFADELFDGVDASGIEQVCELLREEAGQGPVLLVTHEQSLKSVGDRVLTIVNKDHIATIVDSLSTALPLKGKGKRGPRRRVRKPTLK